MSEALASSTVFARRIDPQDGFFDASQHLEEIHKQVGDFDKSSQERDLQAIDMFCGAGNFNAECNKVGIACQPVDLRVSDSHNLLTAKGFWCILSLILRIVSLLDLAGLSLKCG